MRALEESSCEEHNTQQRRPTCFREHLELGERFAERLRTRGRFLGVSAHVQSDRRVRVDAAVFRLIKDAAVETLLNDPCNIKEPFKICLVKTPKMGKVRVQSLQSRC